MNRNELRSNLEEIYFIAWGRSYQRPLVIVKLELPNLVFTDIDPENPFPGELYSYLNSLPKARAVAGYSVNRVAQGSTDVLFLTEEVIQNSFRDLQTILLHELAHCLIDAKEDDFVTLTEPAKELGARFYNNLNPDLEMATRHTEYFCQVLAQGAINYNRAKSFPSHPLFPSAEACLRSALRYEQLWE